jgi:CBS domain-containing protein
MKIAANHVMSSDLILTYSSEDLESAYQKITLNKIRHLPVLDSSGQLIGIISDRDFKRAMLVQTRLTSHHISQFELGAVVADYMTSPAETVEAKTSLLEVTRKMIELKISALMVVSGSNLVGILSHEDLLSVLTVLLQKPTSTPDRIKNKLVEWTYSSPIGQVLENLAEMGF